MADLTTNIATGQTGHADLHNEERTAINNRLRFDAAQSLSGAQQLQARQNLGTVDVNGYGFLANMPPGYTHSLSLTDAKAAVSRAAITSRSDIFLRVVGGASDAEWPSPWLLQGFDVWDQFPGVVRRGAVAKVSTASSGTAFPSVVIPASTTDGDRGFLFLGRGSSTSGTAGTVTGWTFYATYTAATTGIVDVYTRTMVAADAGVTLTPPFAGTVQRLSTTVAVYGGVASVVAPTGFQETVAGSSHATPTITAPTAGAVWVTFVGERSSTPSTAYTPPTGTTIAASDFGAATGGSWTVALADSLPTYLTGTVGGGAWVGTTTTNMVDTISIGLVAA